MSYQKQTWENRRVERPNTFTTTENGDGSVTLTEAPGEILTEGTVVSASRMAHIENGIAGADSAAAEAQEQLTDLSASVAALSLRMDGFTALDDGSTTGDAELQDIRAGWDGTPYESAGAAVRGQAQAVNGRVTSLESALALQHELAMPEDPVQEYYKLGSSVTVGTSVIKQRTSGSESHYILEVHGVTSGEVFRITARDGSTARPWAVLDQYRVLQAQAASDTATSALVEIPTGCDGGTLIVQVREAYIASASVVRVLDASHMDARITENSERTAGLVRVSETQPTDGKTQIWVKPLTDEYEVPTFDEFEQARSGRVRFSAAAKKYYDLGDGVSVGDYISPVPATGSSYHCLAEVADLVPGETFSIKAKDGQTARPWAILDADRLLLAKADGDTVNTDVTVPEDGAILLLQVAQSQAGNARVIRKRNVYDAADAAFASETGVADINRRFRREKGHIYLGASTTMDITSGSSGALVISFSGRLNFKLIGDNSGAKDWTDISADLTESQITIDGNAAVITLPAYSWLVYDPAEEQLEIRNNNGSGYYQVQADDVVLLYNAYAQPVSGILHERWLDEQVRTADARLTAAEESIADITGGADTSAALTALAAKLNSAGPVDCFLYFTDPHLLENSVTAARRKAWMDLLRDYARQLPVDFVVCGGDWIGNSDTPQAASEKMGRALAEMKSRFDRFHMLLGNHDTNYQGTERLSKQANCNLWYRGGKSYYTFETPSALYIVLDTGVENSNFSTSANHAYYKAEADWLAETLRNNSKGRVILLQHMVYSSWSDQTESVLSAGFLAIADAYNNQSSASITTEDGTVTYSFDTAPAGKAAVCLAGHSHHDGTATLHGIPCAIRTSLRYDGSTATSQPVFDLVTIDYAANKMNCVRIGARGESLTDFAIID